jgi:hypothetical protein
MLETATKFVLGLITENEEVKKFPHDFVTASMKWIRSWFLTDDDPATKKVLESDQPAEAKKATIEAKIQSLQQNPVFQQELTERLQGYTAHIANSKNVVTGHVSGHTVHIGDVYHSANNPAAPTMTSLTELERQGETQRLQRLLVQKNSFQIDYDNERSEGYKLAILDKINRLNTEIETIKNKMGI